jgi:hypothetical protein
MHAGGCYTPRMTSSPRASLLFALAFAGLAAAAGCTVPQGADDVATTNESALRALTAGEILGPITSGQTKGPVFHTGEPRYRAYTFAATAGASIDAWVKSSDGDAVAFLADATFKTVAMNDDASFATTDAHVVASALTAGTYYLVFRERDMEPASFVVSLLVADVDGGLPVSDAGVDADAAPPRPVPGATCTVPDMIASEPCGACGTREILCLVGPTPGSPSTWSHWSVCTNEVPGGCIPGTVESAACGFCGTALRTCTALCAWNAGVCTGQPANACIPGKKETSSAGCLPGTARERTCESSCRWGGFSATCSPLP